MVCSQGGAHVAVEGAAGGTPEHPQEGAGTHISMGVGAEEHSHLLRQELPPCPAPCPSRVNESGASWCWG